MVYNGYVVLVVRGHHSRGPTNGFKVYYQHTIMKALSKWRFVASSEVEWILLRDAN
jgi:5-deoxy-D-glucuronate isomerase